MPITLDTNYITISYSAGDAKGDSISNPYRLQDIYDADVSNGWGIVEKMGSAYRINGRGLQIGLSTITPTSFLMNIEILIIENSPLRSFLHNGHNGRIEIKYSTIYNLNSAKVFHMTRGNTLIEYSHIYSNYSNYLNFGGYSADLPFVFQKSFITNNQIIFVFDNLKFIDMTLAKGGHGITPFNPFVENTRTKLIDYASALYTAYIPTTPSTFRNLQGVNLTNGMYWRNYVAQPNAVVNFIDCDFDITKNVGYTNIDGNQYANHISTFKWYFSEDNTNLVLYDKDDNIVLSKEVNNSDYDEIKFADVHFQVTGNVLTALDIVYYQPFKLVASKDGYDDLIISDIYVTAGQPTIIRGELVETEPPIYYQQELNGQIISDTISGDILTNNISGDVISDKIYNK